MEKQRLNEWIAALRSGDWEQGSGTLQCGDGSFCCLGVLCDLIDADAWEKGNDGYVSWNGACGDLTQVSFSCVPDDYFLAEDLQNTLIGMNDQQGASFDDIANYLEANADDICETT